MNLLNFVTGSEPSIAEDEELMKTAHEIAEKEEEFRKVAEEQVAYGKFIGKGFVAGVMDKVAMFTGATASSAPVNPPSAAVGPANSSIELPSDAPGPNSTLKTTRPGGGEQHNNEMYANKINEKRLRAGLNDLQGSGIGTLSGADNGTSAIFSVDHNQK